MDEGSAVFASIPENFLGMATCSQDIFVVRACSGFQAVPDTVGFPRDTFPCEFPGKGAGGIRFNRYDADMQASVFFIARFSDQIEILEGKHS